MKEQTAVNERGAPLVVVFDVNETLSDMRPLASRFTDLGAPEHLWRLWFAGVLRDGIARTAASAPERFPIVADGVLRGLLAEVLPAERMDDAVAHVMAGFSELSVHCDVAEGARALAGDGFRLVTLSNGAAVVAERLLARAGIRERFEACLSVDDAGAWKPDARAYAYAGRACGAAPWEMVLVAVHPWDIDGASRAGLRTAWINRTGGEYPDHMAPPEIIAEGIDRLPVLLRSVAGS